MTLYEIKEDILKAINNIEIDEDTGEIMNTDALDDLQEQFSDKAENIALYIKTQMQKPKLSNLRKKDFRKDVRL